MTPAVDTKACTVCGQVKPLSDFYRHKRDGYHARCKVCHYQESRARVSKNRPTINARRKAWRATRPEKEREQGRAFYHKHREKRIANTLSWVKRNPERKTAIQLVASRAYKVRKRGAPGRHTADDIIRLREIQQNRCAYCDHLFVDGYHVDHMQPLSRGGSNWPENLHLTCKPCNVRKKSKTHEEFCQLIGLR
jgi:5-methylcytosine-specific restriction endonuclease McrA